MRLQYAKQLLPTYNIFDERRHFEPGPDVAKVLRIGSAQVGLLMCEDGWNDDGGDYVINPFERMRDAAPDLVISINASPSHIGKREQRHQMFGGACAPPRPAHPVREPGRRTRPGGVRRCIVRGRARGGCRL